MKKTIFAALAMGTTLAFTAIGTSAVAQGPNSSPQALSLQEEVKDSWIFTFAPDIGRADIPDQANAAANQSGGRVTHVYRNSIKGFAAKMSETAAQNLVERNPNILSYEADGIAYIIGPWPGAAAPGMGMGGGGGGGTPPPPEEIPYGVTRVGGPVSGASNTAWVIDTGIDSNHPDLNVDPRSANFVSRGKNSAEDGNGHGTHVAGTIAAIGNNGIGVVGVAEGASVVGVRVLNNNGSGTFSDIIAGVDYVGANAAVGDAANMSLGGTSSSTALDNAVIAVANQGVLFAIAAGNEAQDANNVTPARANHANIYTVSAIDSGDNFASFSNFGNPPVDCAAPGVGVLSTVPDGGYATFSGTSMAAPHVAGILLFGNPRFSGNAIGDPDGNPDPVCVF